MIDYEPFLSHLQMTGKGSRQTIRAYRNDLKLFEAFAIERSVTEASQISDAIVRDYIVWMRQKTNTRTGQQGLADASIARRLAAISSFLEYLRGALNQDLHNPLKHLPIKWKRNDEPKPVDPYDLDMLLASIPSERDRVLFTLLVASGLRVSEVHQLNRDSIAIQEETMENGEEHVIGCGEVVGKGGKRRKFYVDEATLIAYAEYLETRTDKIPALFISERLQRMAIRTMQERLAHWCKQIKFRQINIHRLRHTYATRLVNAGISSMVLRDLMGHDSLPTTLRYAKISDKTLARGYFSAMENIGK